MSTASTESVRGATWGEPAEDTRKQAATPTEETPSAEAFAKANEALLVAQQRMLSRVSALLPLLRELEDARASQ